MADHDLPTHEPAGQECPACGAQIDRQVATCPLCGADVSTLAAAPEIPELIRPAERPRRRPLQILFGVIAVGIIVGAGALFLRNRSFAAASARPTPSPAAQEVALHPTDLLTVTAPPTASPTRPGTATPSPTFTPAATNTQPPAKEHIVQQNDTILGIAIQYGASPDAILAANNLTADSILHIGQKLIIPIPTPTNPPLSPTGPAISGAGGSSSTITGTTTVATANATNTPALTAYEIKEGDTILTIAQQFGITEQALLDANNLKEDSLLHIGQKLIIPNATPSGQPSATVAQGRTYTVEKGDTLGSIALKVGVSVDTIQKLNHIDDPTSLQTGQVLVLPDASPTPTIAPTQGPTATPTSTPEVSSPVVLYPPDGEYFAPAGEPIVLQWASVGILGQNQAYRVLVTDQSTPGQPPYEALVRTTALRLPDTLRPGDAAVHFFRWTVGVVQTTGTTTGDHQGYIYLSDQTDPRYFRWAGLTSTSTATPQS